jgi:hypothetical protein
VFELFDDFVNISNELLREVSLHPTKYKEIIQRNREERKSNIK